MSAVRSENVLRVKGRWLALALWLVACGEDPVQPPPSDDDDSDVGEEAPADDDDHGSRANRDAGRVDAGTGSKDGGKPSNDARAPASPDARPSEGNEPPEGDDDTGDDESGDDDGQSTDAGTRPDGGNTTPKPSGDAGATGESDAEAPGERTDLGKGDGKDVITIGDSWMSYLINGGGIERALLAASGQPYRTYAVAGTKLLDGVIPRQYDSAKRANPDIKTVVMTGGGNDLLLTGMSGGSCSGSCMKTIDDVAARLDKLWTQMGMDGVKDVVYIEYSEGGSNGPSVRYGIEKVGPVCKNHKALRCHFMLSDPIINKDLVDGIHPTQAACTKLGKAAYELMEKEGMRR